MISRLNALSCVRNYGILSTLLISFAVAPNCLQAQTSAPGLLQPAYMPSASSMVPMNHQPIQMAPAVGFQSNHNFSSETNLSQAPMSHQAASIQHPIHPSHQIPTDQLQVQQPDYHNPPVSPATDRYSNAQQMVNSRVPRGNDLSATNQHSLLQYRRMYRNGTTPQPHELVGQWKGVNKGIVEIAGYGQFIKDIHVGPNGQVQGDNVQVSQVKPGQVRFNGWQPKFDYQAGDYERLGKFQVQAADGRGFFGHGATLSYADGGNAKSDPAKLLQDQVVRIDGNHMLGRAVAKFGPIKIPLAYFVLERREEPLPKKSW